MSSEDITPEKHPAQDVRQITVEVPAHRAAQFERFHQRFLDQTARWDAQVGNEDLGGRGRRRHRHGRCGTRPGAQSQA